MPIALVSSTDEKRWHEQRDLRVTKTDAVRLYGAGISTWKRIYAEKNEGSSFHGNASTERGHRLEPVVQSWVEANYGIPPANMLYANDANPLHAATPDCALLDDGEWSIFEIKTTVKSFAAGLPKKIILDVLWQRHVMGAGWSAVAWWHVDEQGQPLTIEPQVTEVPYDEVETQKLIDGVNAYLAWVEAGCPDHDEESDLPTEIVEAVAAVNAGKAAEKVIREWCERGGEPVNKTIPAGSIKFSVAESTTFDKAAFLAAEPELAQIVARADEVLKIGQKSPVYRKPTVRTSLTIAPPKKEEVTV